MPLPSGPPTRMRKPLFGKCGNGGDDDDDADDDDDDDGLPRAATKQLTQQQMATTGCHGRIGSGAIER